MKKSNIIYVAVAVAVIALILYFSLRHSEADGHNHSEGEKPETEEAHAKGEEANAGNKEVELNEAQFKSSAIKLGSFVPKNLSEVINANGYTELPPRIRQMFRYSHPVL